MSSVSAPFGMRPAHDWKGLVRARAYAGGIPTGFATAIFKFQPVKLLTTGLLTPVAADTDDWLGVFAGVEYTDSNGRHYRPNWVASTAATDIVAWVWDDPDLIYEVQADGSIPLTALGDQSNFTNLTAGSTLTGFSQATISATLVGAAAQGQVRIIDFSDAIDNAVGDAFTVVQVKNARHQYVANKVAI